MDIKHFGSEFFPNPESILSEKCFSITISKNEVEFECEWDYGWGGRGNERIFLPLETVEKFISDYKEMLSSRSNEHPTTAST